MNWKFKYILILIFLSNTHCTLLLAQKDKSKSDSVSAGFISSNFMHTSKYDVLASNGIHGSLGINIAGLFNKKYIVGICTDFRFFKDLSNFRSSNKISGEISNNILPQNNQEDSLRAEYLKNGFGNNSKFNHFFGSYMLNYGIMVSLFPKKYGGILLMVKRGQYLLPIEKTSNLDGEEYYDLKVSNRLSIQLTSKPFLFINSQKGFFKFIENNIFLSLFYEKLSLKKSTLDEINLNQFVTQDFLKKRGIDHHFGFKISIGIY